MRVHRGLSTVLSAVVLVAAGIGSAGCVGGSRGLSAEDRERLKAYIMDSAPEVQHKLDVNFENKVHLIGYKFDPESAHPGQEVKLTYYWRCDDTVEDGWMLFTHTKDEGSSKLGNLDGVGPLREVRNGSHQALGPDRWEKGKFYIDEQTFKVPDDTQGSEITIFVGVWKGDARLRIISGPNDGDNSAIVGKIKTGKGAQSQEHTTNSEVPSMTVNKLAANTKIAIDGKGDEPVWGGAGSTGPFVNVGTGKPDPTSPVGGSARVLWDDANLYILLEVQDGDFYTGFTDARQAPDPKQGKLWTAGGQPKLWMKDTIEMMLEPDAVGSNTNYYELQINPQNKVFKSQFDTLKKPDGDGGPDGPFGHEDWDPKLKSAVTIQKGSDGKPTGYTVEAAIPWAGYSKAANHPPKPGEVWRVNFYAMKGNGGVAWSPILGLGNFHFASRFGKITWAAPGTPPPALDLAALAGDAGAVAAGVVRPRFPVHGPPLRASAPPANP